MRNLKKFSEIKNSQKPVILYLHGLEGELDENYKGIINELGCDYIGISFDYKNTPDIFNIIEGMKIDGIIGHSLGGYLAYYISNEKKIPSLLLMPSFDPEDIKYVKIPTRAKKCRLFNKKDVLIGKKDESVDYELQMQNLVDLNVAEEIMDHDLTNHIFRKYSGKFIRRYFSEIK